jgi:chromosome segregation ATPase
VPYIVFLLLRCNNTVSQHIDNLKKENFNIKLRVHFLEERLAQLAPDQIDAALKQNINLKIEVQQRGIELKKLKKLVIELERELERLQRGGAGVVSRRERELEEKLEEREREIREIVESRGGENGFGGSTALKRRVEELEADNDDLRGKLEDQAEIIVQRDEEKEDLADEIEALRLDVEEMQRRRDAESIERSQSRIQILEEREEREAVEDDLNSLRDKLAAATIELQQKEDEIEMKNREIDELVSEHDRIVEVVEQEWRGEVEEARGQVEELRDVSDLFCSIYIIFFEANYPL